MRLLSDSAGPAPAEVRLEMPSSSSMNRMQGAFLRAVSKSFLTFWTPGSAYAQDLMPFYFWNNYKGTGTTQDAPELHSDPSCPAIANLARQNRDWYTENTSFNGTTGVGSGSFANRPDTCTTGVAYWATDQGEWNSKVSGPDGQLYKCTATNTWTLYYIPLRYPHPLQSNLPVPEAPSDLTAD